MQKLVVLMFGLFIAGIMCVMMLLMLQERSRQLATSIQPTVPFVVPTQQIAQRQPTAQPQIAPPTAQVYNILHTVQPNETLMRIAQAYGISLEQLAIANNITNANLIHVGQQLEIPLNPGTSVALANDSAPSDQLSINGIPSDAFLSLPSETVDNIRDLYGLGQVLGNNPYAFAKIGDSITVNTSFMYAFGTPYYDLDNYQHLQPIIDLFSLPNGHGTDSFRAKSLAAEVGWSSSALLDPAFRDEQRCNWGESPLRCEYRISQPAFAIIMLGTNDSGYRSLSSFHNDMKRIIEVTESLGIIPIISTIPNRPTHVRRIAEMNQILRDLAAEHHIPLLDYALVMSTLPNDGLAWDDLHPSSSPDGYETAGIFTPTNLRYGYVVRNLTALEMLNRVWWWIEGYNSS